MKRFALILLAFAFSMPLMAISKPKDMPAQLQTQASIPYPDSAIEMGQEGTTLVKALIRPDGTPESVEIASSSGSEVLDQASMEIARKSSYIPAQSKGKSSASWLTFPITWKLSESALSLQKARKVASVGWSYLQLKDYAKALPVFQSASDIIESIHSKPKWRANIYLGLGTAYLGLKQPLKAIEALQKGVDLEPENSDLLFTLAAADEETDKSEEAIAAYQKLTHVVPDLPQPFVRLGYLYYKKSSWENAEGAWQVALDLYKKSGNSTEATQIEKYLTAVRMHLR